MKNLGIACPACTLKWDNKKSFIANQELLVCINCGLWFCKPDELQGIDYDEVYRTLEYQEEYFDSLDKNEDWGKLTNLTAFKAFFSKIKHPPHAKLLDVGCGVGMFCRAAYSKRWDVKGIDIAKSAIEKGNKNVPFTMLNCTAEEIRNNNEVFDVVTAFEVLEHLIAPYNLLNTVSELIKPGGSFFCTVPNLDCLTVKNSTRKDWTPPIHVLYFTQKALQELLTRSGFKNVVTGILWVNAPPSLPGPELVRYYVLRIKKKVGKPDPLGLWAMGSR